MSKTSFINNKWICGAIPALLLHCSIGTVYCWSLFKADIASSLCCNLGAIEWAFSLAIFFLGMSAAFCGNIVEKNVKFSALLSTLFFSIGMIGTGFSIIYQSIIGLYLSYGVIMGIGLGIGYLTPVKTLMLWFKDNKGLATGIAITGFGLAKVIASPIIEYFQQINLPIEQVFFILGGFYFIFMLLGAFLIKKPEEEAKINAGEKIGLKKSLKIIFNPIYIAIWTVFFLNITCGLALISQEKAILSSIGITVGIGTIAALTAFFNSFGRFGYSTLSDKMKSRSTVYEVIFITSFLSCFTSFFINVLNITWFLPLIVILALFTTNLGYGGGFSTLPSLLSDKFGLSNVSVIHGYCLSAWAWAGLVGNNLGLFIINTLGVPYLLLILSLLYLISYFICTKLIK